ncbi:hypothetical protein F4779DRAFT_619109 [Xylariaceae sp. FL0662B]|nr:hypothetical protein F4779DRAFT_619109 [Xylariaceae sp. FL0662B]
MAQVPPVKRRRDATAEFDPIPAKRARLTRSGAQASRAENEQAVEPPLQQPRPEHTRAPFLRDFVDPVRPNPRAESVNTSILNWLESVGSDREKRNRSDSHLRRADGNPASRKRTRSAPETGCAWVAEGYDVLPTPASIDGSPAPSDLTGATMSSSESSTTNELVVVLALILAWARFCR